MLLLGTAAAVAVATTAEGGATARTPIWVATALRYTGGSAGAADSKRTPVYIGFLNQQGGTPSYPEALDAAVAAVRFVNAKLGGVNGRPLRISACSVVSTDAQLRQCAQRFLEDPAVKVIVQGGLAIDTASFHQTIDGRKPTIGASPAAPADGTAKNTYFLTAGAASQPAALAAYVARFVHPKTVALLAIDNPQLSPALASIRSGLEKAGAKVSLALVDPASTDLVTPLNAAAATRADLIVPLINTPTQCVPYAAAVRQLGIASKPSVALGGCFDEATKRAVGDFLHWTAVSPYASPLLTGDPEVASYRAAMRTYEPDEKNLGTFAPSSFAAVLAAAKILGRVGGPMLTPAAASARLATFNGPVFMGPRTLHWGKAVNGLQAVGTASFRFYTYLGKGRWKDATGGKWVAAAG
jgi:branched-chain amino acid transport system substrate-binding protein